MPLRNANALVAVAPMYLGLVLTSYRSVLYVFSEDGHHPRSNEAVKALKSNCIEVISTEACLYKEGELPTQDSLYGRGRRHTIVEMTIDLPILTALPLPAVSTFPSANCCQWSGDGQLILLTRSAIIMLTPELGVNAELTSSIKKALDKRSSVDGRTPVRWFSTRIEWDKGCKVHQWPADCQEWGAVSLGSLDPSFRAVTCSPSNLSVDAKCLIAVLNSNLEVSLWGSVKNHLSGQWIKIQDCLDVLQDTQSLVGPGSAFMRTLQAQITSIAWSSQADFRTSPTPIINGSLLAAGSRGGTVYFLRYLGGPVPLSCVSAVRVADRWVDHLAWSSWKSPQPRQCEAYLACGITDGSITVVRVVQSLQQIPVPANFTAQYETSVSLEILSVRPYESWDGSITSLKWFDIQGHDSVLTFSTPGKVHLWFNPSSTGSARTEYRCISLRTQKTSVGSSALMPISGITYIQPQDSLVLSLADGSFHVVQKVSNELGAAVAGASTTGLSSETLSAVSRAVFLKVEDGDLGKKDVNRINGMTLCDGASSYAWIHEGCRPTDFSYKHDAKHTSMFVVAELWPGSTDEYLIAYIEEIITNVRASTGEAPMALLRPAFLHIRDTGRLMQLYPRLLDIMQCPQPPDNSATILLPEWSGELTTELRRQFRDSLRAHLFGEDTMLMQRIRVSLGIFCQRYCEHAVAQQAFGQATGDTLVAIWHRVLRAIMRHITAVLRLVSPSDVPFVLRIVLQALLPGTPADLAREAQALSAQVSARVPPEYDASVMTLGLNELCPACNAQVPLDDIATAVCPNGHVWSRCSVTSFILSTPMVRTCTGCGRKALLPISQDATTPTWLPASARSWIVEDLLDATRLCFFCGSSFVTLI